MLFFSIFFIYIAFLYNGELTRHAVPEPALRLRDHAVRGQEGSVGGSNDMFDPEHSFLSKDRDFPLKAIPQYVFLKLHIVSCLQVHPELLGGSEVPGKTKRGIRSDSTLSVNNLVDSSGRHTDILRQPILRDAHWLEELLH